MKKTLIFVSILVMVISLAACNSVEEPMMSIEKTSVEENPIVQMEKRQNSLPILQFDNIKEYESALDKLRSMSSDEERSAWVHAEFPGFISIQDLYQAAGEEMAQSELDTKEKFNAFKSKYASLYFPLENEDAGFYIPIVDEVVPFLASQDCKVLIANTEVNLSDIHNYLELQQTGRAYKEMQNPMRSPAATTSEITFYLRSYDMNSVGPEYDSGWNQYGKRKVKLKARRRFKGVEYSPGFHLSESWFHLEFCFRKKTIFGWANYSCHSTITGTVNIPRFYCLNLNSSHSGTSSHDKEYLYPIYISNDGVNWYYRFYEATCQVTVNFNDISTPLTYTWNMPALVADTPYSASHYPIVPNND